MTQRDRMPRARSVERQFGREPQYLSAGDARGPAPTLGVLIAEDPQPVVRMACLRLEPGVAVLWRLPRSPNVHIMVSASD